MFALAGLVLAVAVYLVVRQYRAKRKILLAEADEKRRASLFQTVNMIAQQSKVEGYYNTNVEAIERLKAQANLVMARTAAAPQLCYPNPDTTEKFISNIKNVMVTTFRAKTEGTPAAAMAAINTDNFKLDFTELGLLSLQLELLSQNNSTSIRFITNADGSLSARLDLRTQNFLMLGLFGVLVGYNDLGDNYMKRFIDANIGALDAQYFAGTPDTFMSIAASVRRQMDEGTSVDPTEDARVASAIQRNISRPIPLSLIGLILIISMYATASTWSCPNACVVSEWSTWSRVDLKPTTPLRPLPTYIGTSRPVATYAQLVAALDAASDGDIIQLTSNITLDQPITISKGICLTATSAGLILAFNLTNNGTVVTVSGDNVMVKDLTIRCEGTGTQETCVHLTSVTAQNNYVHNVTFLTDEYAIRSANKQVQVTNCTFRHARSTMDEHAYVGLSRVEGTTIFANCLFSGAQASANNTTCFMLDGTAAAAYTGTLALLNNNNTGANQVQMVLLSVLNLSGASLTLILRDNSFTTSGGYAVFAQPNTVNCTAGFKAFVLENNTEILGTQLASSSGSRGLIAFQPQPVASGQAPLTPIPAWVRNNTIPALISGAFVSAMEDGSGAIAFSRDGGRDTVLPSALFTTDGTAPGVIPTMTRTRTVVRPATEGGPGCPALSENA